MLLNQSTCHSPSQEPGKALAAKLCAHLRPKCHALLLDASMSSPITVRRNVFQMTLLAAMKLHCQVSAAGYLLMPSVHSVRQDLSLSICCTPAC